jgi:CRP-like cAMP-binding protein
VFPDAHLQEGAGLGVYAVPLDEEPTAVSGEILLPRPMLEAAKTPTLQPRTTPLLSSLDEHALSALINKVTVRSFRPGEKIVVQGERSDSLYVLAEGEVTVYREGRPRLEMGRLQEGAFFGEIALLSRRPQSATVEAISAGLVLEITPEMVSDLIEDYPDVLKVLLRYFRERLIDTLVVTSPLFTAFADEDRKDLAARFTFLEAKPKTLIIPQGQRANGLYVLLAGHLTVGWREDGKRHRVVVSEPGSVFGQTSLLTRNPAPAGVWSRTKCWLLWLDRATFQEVIMTHPQVLAYLSELALQQPADKGQPPLI